MPLDAHGALAALFEAAPPPPFPQPHHRASAHACFAPTADVVGRDECVVRVRRLAPAATFFLAELLSAQPGVRSATKHDDASDPLDLGVFFQLRVITDGSAPPESIVRRVLRDALESAVRQVRRLTDSEPGLAGEHGAGGPAGDD